MKKNQRKNEIIEYALDEFVTSGFFSASTNAIAKNADIAKGLIFHYFTNKEQLYIETLNHSFAIIETYINKKTANLSTFMDVFDLLSELIIAKHMLEFEQARHTALVFSSFENIQMFPCSLQTQIAALAQQYDELFSSFLNCSYLHMQLKEEYHTDHALVQKIMTLLEASYQFEKSQLPEPYTLTTLQEISLDSYISVLKFGLFHA